MKSLPLVFCTILVCLDSSAVRGQSISSGATGSDISLDSLLDVHISTASKYEQTSREAPASVTLITSAEIEAFGYRTLEDVLRNVRGFYVSNDRNYGYVGVRGFGRPTDYNNRLLVLLDGHTLNDNVFGGAFTEPGVDMRNLDRVEIVRGPGSALYGTGAMFAVVNMITKKGNAVDGARISGETGSDRRVAANLLFGKELAAGWDLSLSGTWTDQKGSDLYFQEFDTPATNHGVATNLDWERYFGFAGSIHYSDFCLSGLATSRKKGVPTASWNSRFNDQSEWTLDQREFMEVKFERRISPDKSLQARAYVDHYFYDGQQPLDLMNYDAADGRWAGAEAHLVWDVLANNRLTAGVEYTDSWRVHYTLGDQNVVLFDRNVPSHTLSLYLEDEFQPMEQLSFTIGARRDDYSGFGNSVAPRAAIVIYPLPGSTAKLLYGEAVRAPDMGEAYFEVAPNGIYKDVSLKPERITTFEGVWEQRLAEHLYGSVSVYTNRMNNLIDPVIDPIDSTTSYDNVGEVYAEGLELELNAGFSHTLRGTASVCFQRTVDHRSGDQLTNSPTRSAKVGLIFPIITPLHCSTNIVYESPRETVYGTFTRNYVLADINFAVGPVFETMTLSLLVKNVLNTSYGTPGGFEHRQPIIMQDGRSFIVQAEYVL